MTEQEQTTLKDEYAKLKREFDYLYAASIFYKSKEDQLESLHDKLGHMNDYIRNIAFMAQNLNDEATRRENRFIFQVKKLRKEITKGKSNEKIRTNKRTSKRTVKSTRGNQRSAKRLK